MNNVSRLIAPENIFKGPYVLSLVDAFKGMSLREIMAPAAQSSEPDPAADVMD
jgi:hypothetical protein